MKLHFHPVSTTSRPVWQFCLDNNIAIETHVVDLMTGAHHQPAFAEMNPSKQVPVLEDGDFVLTESSAILKYLAEKCDSPAYPKELKARARVNERMDWFNTSLVREWAYHFIYPQLFPHHTRTPDVAQSATVEWGRDQCARWLQVLNDRLIGNHKYVCGDELTIADYFGAQIIASGDLIGVSLKAFPNVERWMNTMRAMPNWKKVNEATDGYAASLKEKSFVTFAS